MNIKVGDFIKVTKSEQFSEFNKPNNEMMLVVKIEHNYKFRDGEFTHLTCKRKSDSRYTAIGFMLELIEVENLGSVLDILNRKI